MLLLWRWWWWSSSFSPFLLLLLSLSLLWRLVARRRCRRKHHASATTTVCGCSFVTLGFEQKGPIPTEIGRLVWLRRLSFGDNLLTGAGQFFFCVRSWRRWWRQARMTDVTHARVGHPRFCVGWLLLLVVGAGCDFLSGLSQPSWRMWSGCIPTELGLLERATHIYLASNQLTGTARPNVEGKLGNNNNNKETPADERGSGWVRVRFWGCWLGFEYVVCVRVCVCTGRVPTQLGQLGELEILSLADNRGLLV
jgi:hypothetical protein